MTRRVTAKTAAMAAREMAKGNRRVQWVTGEGDSNGRSERQGQQQGQQQGLRARATGEGSRKVVSEGHRDSEGNGEVDDKGDR